MFCFCCAACCQHVCREDATLERASVCSIPKRVDRPLAKDLPESRLFTLETVGAWKHAIQKHNLSPSQSPQRDPSSSPWRLYMGQTRTCFRLQVGVDTNLRVCREAHHFRRSSVMFQSVETSQWLLITDAICRQVVRGPFITGRSLSGEHSPPPAAGDQVSHVTCSPLINQTRASSQQWSFGCAKPPSVSQL